MGDVGGEQAEGTVDRRGVGDDHAANRQLLAEGAGEHPAGPAEGVQDEVARIEPALDGDLADEIGDLRRGDPVDADGGFLDRLAEGIGDDRP